MKKRMKLCVHRGNKYYIKCSFCLYAGLPHYGFSFSVEIAISLIKTCLNSKLCFAFYGELLLSDNYPKLFVLFLLLYICVYSHVYAFFSLYLPLNCKHMLPFPSLYISPSVLSCVPLLLQTKSKIIDFYCKCILFSSCRQL